MSARARLAQTLLKKNPTVLRAAKLAYRHVKHMDWEMADDYLAAKSVEANATDPERGRQTGHVAVSRREDLSAGARDVPP